MKDANKTKTQLINELTQLRQRVAELTAAEAKRAQAEEELSRLAAVIEQATASIIITDLDGSMVYVNPFFEQLTGYSVTEALGENPRILKSGHHDLAFYQELWATITSGQTWTGVFVDRRKDGSLYHEDATIFPIKGGDGQIVNYAAVKRDISERVRAEKALKESEEKLRLIFENAFDGISFYEELIESGTRRLLDCNDRYAEMAGRSKKELLEIGNTSLIQKNLGPVHSPEENWRIRQEKISYKGLFSWIRPDGKENIVEYSAAPIQIGDRALTIGIDRDITERVRAEEALRRQATELEALAQISAALRTASALEEILSLILQKTIQTLGAASGVVFLIESETGDLVARACHPPGSYPLGLRCSRGEGITGHVAAVGELHVTEDLASEPLAHVLPEEAEHLRDVRGHMSLPLRTQEHIVGVMNVALRERRFFSEDEMHLANAIADIAANALYRAMVLEGLEAEVTARTAEIRAEQEKSEIILRSVGDAIVVADRGMRIQYVNPAFTTLTGYTADEVLGQRASAVSAGVASEQVRRAIGSALAEGAQWQGEVVGRRKDGRTYDAALTVAPMHDAEGEIVGYVSSHHDISQLRELDRARYQFITNVSHQLRTPVASLRLFVQLLRKSRRPEKTERYFEVVEQEVERLDHLIQDILEMTTLDSGQAVTAWEPFSLALLIADAAAAYQGRAEAAGLSLETMPLPPDLPPARGDRVRLNQALGELLENAITFTPAGGVVTLEGGRSEADGRRWLTVAVRDTGPGISPQEQDRIFDRFYRGKLAEAGHIPGTGLGLSIAQEIIRAHGGQVTVQSEVGRGSTFAVWLPLVELDE